MCRVCLFVHSVYHISYGFHYKIFFIFTVIIIFYPLSFSLFLTFHYRNKLNLHCYIYIYIYRVFQVRVFFKWEDETWAFRLKLTVEIFFHLNPHTPCDHSRAIQFPLSLPLCSSSFFFFAIHLLFLTLLYGLLLW
jgi:hypothetical protein